MSRALVLGGGGPVGIGWESGLVVGLAAGGVNLGRADLVVGTSAGSVVGAQLALGADLGASLAELGTGGAVAPAPGGMETLLNAMAAVAGETSSPDEVRVALGRLAVESPTPDEDSFVSLFSSLAGQPWPQGFECTAIDVETGALKVWDADTGAALDRAVAASCAVPGIYPPITIHGRRYMDGGMRTALNTDLASGHDVVVAVSCFPLSLPEGMSDPLFGAMIQAVEAEFTAVRDQGGALEVVVPGDEFLEISGWGLHLMDFARVHAAFDAGRRQAEQELERLGGPWAA